MASNFCFCLLVISAMVIECRAPLRRPIKELSEIPEIQSPFICGSVHQCYGCEQCDNMCRFYDNNCCGENSTTPIPKLAKWQYSCVRTFPDMEEMPMDCFKPDGDVQGVLMVTKCSEDWGGTEEKLRCEEDSDTLLSRIPVYEKSSEYITFKNMYCALCNNVNMQSITFWDFQVQCNFSNDIDIVANFDNELCVTYLRPATKYRMCATGMIETCSAYYSNFSIYDIQDRCENGQTAPIYDYDYYAYKNEDCYLCNAYNLTELDVRMRFSGLYFELLDCNRPNLCHVPVPSYSLKQLVNLNIGDVRDTLLILDTGNILTRTSCSSSEESCASETCEFVVIQKTAVAFNETTLHFRPLDIYFAMDMFYFNGTEIHVCLNDNQREYLREAPSENIIERILTFVGLLASVICLLATFCVYLCLRQLRNAHGNILMNLMVSLFCAQLSFLVSFSFQNVKTACVTFAVLTHYFFLVAFCSMNAVGVDTFKTFSDLLVQGSLRARVIVSIFYSWTVPFLIVLTSTVLDYIHVPESIHPYRPEYGNGSCWINSSNALLTFFVIPLAVFKMVDIVLFAATAVILAKAIRKGSSIQKTQSRCTFLINLKLALIMGLTWMFSFLATSLDNSFLWYLFIVCNSLQGLFIFLSLTCTRNIYTMIRRKRQITGSSHIKTASSSL